jgi:HAE1 family hydrophobic/amphiphilic exporter-1
MSLGGLALGVGMLVDNSIVVLESIVRHRRMGNKERSEAVIDGTNEVAQAITASTLTTIAVFLPILFVEGIARQIFKDQALTVTYALLVSLAVAVTLTPMVAALGKEKHGRRRWWNPLSWAPSQDRFDRGDDGGVRPAFDDSGRLFGAIRARYVRMLEGALARRSLVVLTSLALFTMAVLGMQQLGTDLIPQFSRGEFRFDLELPAATPIEHTHLVMQRLEQELDSVPQIQTVFTNIGMDAGESGTLRSKKENHAELNILLEPGLGREGEQASLAAIRKVLDTFPEIHGTLQQTANFTFKTPIEIEIYGYDLVAMTDVANRTADVLRGIPGLKDISTNMEDGNPEVQIRFDRDKLKLAGLGLRESSEALRTNILGRVATDFKDRDRQIDVRVRSDQAQELNFADLNTMVIGYHQGIPVQLASVANVVMERGPARISRISQTRAAVVSANLVGRDLGGVSRDIEQALAGISLPPNVTIELAGQNSEMQRSLKSLIFAAVLAIFMVYLVMASQFESLLNPFLILFAVPMALIGVVGGLYLTGTSVSVVVMIGGIMLAGIVVNNGIVLVDLIGQLHRQGRTVRESVLEAGAIRLRPILMTTATTILALLPLAFGKGEGAELMAPLAVTVIGGLLVSTLLTLVLIPVLYVFVHREAPGGMEA